MKVEYRTGRSPEALDDLANDVVDLWLADPPYGTGDGDHQYGRRTRWKVEHGHEFIMNDKDLGELEKVLPLMRRTMQPKGLAMVFGAPSKRREVIELVEASGELFVFETIPWDKGAPGISHKFRWCQEDIHIIGRDEALDLHGKTQAASEGRVMGTRRDIQRFGEHGNRVILFREDGLARVQWTVNGQRKTKSWPAKMYATEAKAFARGLERGVQDITPETPARVTLRSLWNAYENSEFEHLRERSRVLYRGHWEKWEIMFGRDFPVDDTTKLMMPQLVAELRNRQGLGVNSVREIVRTIKRIYAWGEDMELVTRNRVHTYTFKVHKDQRPKPVAEYRPEEYDKLLAALDPESATQWRAYVALVICGHQGARQNAVLHLKWSDILNGRITWRAKWDKTGKEWSQPIREKTLRAFEVASTWREHDGYKGDWILYSGSSKNQGEVYTIQSLWAALKAAQTRSGVKNLPGRGAHGLRRMLAGNVMAKTGDPSLAVGAINDGIGQAPRYITKREEAVDAAILSLDEVKTA